MKAFSMTLTLIISMTASLSLAADYPLLAQYKELTTKLVDMTQQAQSAEEVKTVQDQTQDLIALGFDVMDLYASKNPVCTEQFAAFKTAAPEAASMTLAQIKAKFHNGVGLPAAPRHCYFGRSQVVHPMLNVVRLNGELTAETREAVLEDFAEVIEHLEKIQANLDNPPN